MDLVAAIFSNEINSSGYVKHEHDTLASIRDCLIAHGAEQLGEHTWRQSHRTVYVRLVDSVEDVVDLNCVQRDDLIITDNYIGRALNCAVVPLPDSWYGIYDHRPTVLDQPDKKDYSFLINRLDANRLELLLELSKRIHLHQGVINFNCVMMHNWNLHDHDTAMHNFQRQWQDLHEHTRRHYHGEYQRLAHKMPFRNHDLGHDQAMQSVRLNLVAETYCSDDVICFSEKIFRAMVVPCAWTLFGSRFAVQRLRRLGFDVLDDVISHAYDLRTRSQDKVISFVQHSVNNISDIDPARLRRAANHNLWLLENWHRSWPTDRDQWLTFLPQYLKL